MARRGGGHRGGGRMSAPRRVMSRPSPRPRHRRPALYGGGYVWNGIYWVNPQGLCYTKDDEGVYTLVDCAPVSIADVTVLFNGTDSTSERDAGGTGGTMDSSFNAVGPKTAPKSVKIIDTKIPSLLAGAFLGLAFVYVARKYKLCNCFD